MCTAAEGSTTNVRARQARGRVGRAGADDIARAPRFNAVPAAGGSDAENVEEAKERAPLTLKSRDRAFNRVPFEFTAILLRSPRFGRGMLRSRLTRDGLIYPTLTALGRITAFRRKYRLHKSRNCARNGRFGAPKI